MEVLHIQAHFLGLYTNYTTNNFEEIYLNPVPTNWMALAGRLVIMLTPSLATVWMPEVPAEMTVAGARTRLPGTLRTKPVPGETRSMVVITAKHYQNI